MDDPKIMQGTEKWNGLKPVVAITATVNVDITKPNIKESHCASSGRLKGGWQANIRSFYIINI